MTNTTNASMALTIAENYGLVEDPRFSGVALVYGDLAAVVTEHPTQSYLVDVLLCDMNPQGPDVYDSREVIWKTTVMGSDIIRIRRAILAAVRAIG